MDRWGHGRPFLRDELVGLISSCSNVNFLTPQVTNPNPTSSPETPDLPNGRTAPHRN